MVCERFNESDRTLDKKKKFKSLLDEVKKEIEICINEKANSANKTQLIHIYKQLKFMKNILNPKEFMPTFSRIIVDSWDYNSKLGLKLLDVVEEYKKLND